MGINAPIFKNINTIKINKTQTQKCHFQKNPIAFKSNTENDEIHISEASKERAEIIKKANEVLEKSSEIQIKAGKELEEVSKIIKSQRLLGLPKKYDEKGNLKRKFSDEFLGKVMEEYEGDKIIRRTTFDPITNKILFIEKNYDFIPRKKCNTSEEFIYDKKSQELSAYKSGCEDIMGECSKIQEEFLYKDGLLHFYTEGDERNCKGNIHFDERLIFENDKPNIYVKNYNKTEKNEYYTEKRYIID